MFTKRFLTFGLCCICLCCTATAGSDPLVAAFQRPPDSAKPWTYWFWINGNIDWQPPVESRRSESKLESRYILDLGRVEVMAEVQLNGVDLGVLWKPPFVADVTRVLRPGGNRLEVKVTNLWPNRLIGDERFPDDCTADGTWKTGPIPAWPEWFLQGRPRPEPRRKTFTTWKYYTADSPLLPSGLLGPVTLEMSWRIEVR